METRRLFDQGSAAYASARPRYPDALYRHLAGLCGQRRRAWDCATGTGQAALGLAQYFGEVLASDTSTQQIEHAVVHPGIRYSVQDAEATDYPDAAFDLVCVAQAWHWFDHSRFNRELLRVLRPGGVFAAWGYGWFSIDAQIDAAIDEEYLRPIGPYWAQQNRLLWNAYRDVELPLGELPRRPSSSSNNGAWPGCSTTWPPGRPAACAARRRATLSCARPCNGSPRSGASRPRHAGFACRWRCGSRARTPDRAFGRFSAAGESSTVGRPPSNSQPRNAAP